MRQLQLYINNQRVDLFKDESVSLTQTIQNVKDIAKVFTEFTQTFSVPGFTSIRSGICMIQKSHWLRGSIESYPIK